MSDLDMGASTCPACSGCGRTIDEVDCDRCGGTGVIVVYRRGDLAADVPASPAIAEAYASVRIPVAASRPPGVPQDARQPTPLATPLEPTGAALRAAGGPGRHAVWLQAAGVRVAVIMTQDGEGRWVASDSIGTELIRGRGPMLLVALQGLAARVGVG